LDRADLSAKEYRKIEDEASQLIRLDHPNITQVYDAGEWEGRPYIAMEFRQGMPLDSLLAARRFSVNEAIDFVADLAETEHYIHEQGMLHRDLKPSNVLVTKNVF